MIGCELTLCLDNQQRAVKGRFGRLNIRSDMAIEGYRDAFTSLWIGMQKESGPSGSTWYGMKGETGKIFEIFSPGPTPTPRKLSQRP